MPEIVEARDVTPASADGWKMWYRVRRDDGGGVYVDPACTATAEAVALAHQDGETLAFIADRGLALALLYAEAVQAHPARGKALVRLWVDGVTGTLAHVYDNEYGGDFGS